MDLLQGVLDRFVGEADGDYQCLHCGTDFDRQRQLCPECGGYCIERRQW